MGSDRDRDQHGQYADRIPPETVLEVFDNRDDLAEPITATDVTEALGIARRTAHNKLNRLVERGILETRKVGARGRVFWQPIAPTELEHRSTEAAARSERSRDDSP